MLDRRSRRLLLIVGVMCLSSAAFNSTQVSREFYDSNDMSNNRTTEQ